MKLLVRALLALPVLSLYAAKAPPPSGKPIVPTKTISLFNGKNLSTFYTWLRTTGYEYPDRVFTVVPNVDGRPGERAAFGRHRHA